VLNNTFAAQRNNKSLSLWFIKFTELETKNVNNKNKPVKNELEDNAFTPF